ncbi:MAG: putative undecaprenyl-phosphate N-acetylglucosaminyl 1-phosphate transferase [Alphaproteobacteria bacterium MarineAlpha9_Bin4]|nr:hypothetical protein [Pelagibacterales bacterium]PPR25651.1 MAG: putative undecaprenyl-phosphate N-acetylglucosaminyl 1-phosphate transferase [Alphaproteobacteria bacterium MarineAlpha9_Bin4]|tara:strand:- start:217 stop:1236 length:1020 start_codon:yes stop_codon:yes gene_type:complete
MQSLTIVFNENQIFFSITLSLVFTILAFKILLPIFVSMKFLDNPTERSNHLTPISLGGGLVVVPLIILIPFSVGYHWNIIQILTLLILFFISLLDDFKNVKASLRLAIHFFSITIYVHFYLIDQITFFQEIERSYLIFLTYFFLILTISWFINAFNFMDGIDGITSVNIVYLTSSLILLNYYLGLNSSTLHYTIIGVTLGFLFFNWSPANIFLGDSGSIPLGFLMITLLLDLALKGYWVAALILPMYYILDTSLTLIVRAYNRENFMQAHSQHFYQKAVRSGKTHKQVCYSIIVLSFGLFLFALSSVIEKNKVLFLILALAWCVLFLLKFSKKKIKCHD